MIRIYSQSIHDDAIHNNPVSLQNPAYVVSHFDNNICATLCKKETTITMTVLNVASCKS